MVNLNSLLYPLFGWILLIAMHNLLLVSHVLESFVR